LTERQRASAIQNQTWSPSGSNSAPNQSVPFSSRVGLRGVRVRGPPGQSAHVPAMTIVAMCGAAAALATQRSSSSSTSPRVQRRPMRRSDPEHARPVRAGGGGGGAGSLAWTREDSVDLSTRIPSRLSRRRRRPGRGSLAFGTIVRLISRTMCAQESARSLKTGASPPVRPRTTVAEAGALQSSQTQAVQSRRCRPRRRARAARTRSHRR